MDEDTLEIIDQIEMNGKMYNRDLIHVQLVEDGTGEEIKETTVLECETYFLKNYNLNLLNEEFREHYSSYKYPLTGIKGDDEGLKQFHENRHRLFRS